MAPWKLNPLDLIEALTRAGWEVRGTYAYKTVGGSTRVRLDISQPPINVSWKKGTSDRLPWEEYQPDKNPVMDRVVSDVCRLVYQIPDAEKEKGRAVRGPEDPRPQAKPEVIEAGPVKKGRTESFGAYIDRGAPKEEIMARFALSEHEFGRKLAELQRIRAEAK